MKKMLKALWAILATTLDALNLFSDDQAVTDTANSTNVVDQGDGFFDGSQRIIGIFITETFTVLTNLTISLHSDSVAAMSTNAAVFTLPAITLASGGLAAGKYYEIPIPVQADRYLRLTYTVGGTTAGAGKITAGIIHESGSPTAFRNGNL
jgi:Bbp16